MDRNLPGKDLIEIPGSSNMCVKFVPKNSPEKNFTNLGRIFYISSEDPGISSESYESFRHPLFSS